MSLWQIWKDIVRIGSGRSPNEVVYTSAINLQEFQSNGKLVALMSGCPGEHGTSAGGCFEDQCGRQIFLPTLIKRVLGWSFEMRRA